MKSISEDLLSRIEIMISRYSLIQDKDIFVAYSGGKDSLFLCLALQALGYYVHPIIIDIGHNVDWTLALENVKTHRMDALVLNREYIYNHYPEIIYAVDHLFETVVKISGEIQQSATICTPCYNAKMTILRKWAEENGVSKIAIGHHGTDAISSMLKSFFLYR